MFDMFIAVVMAIHWPVVFYLISIVSVVVIEPLANFELKLVPMSVRNIAKSVLAFGKTVQVKKNAKSNWAQYFTVPKRWFTHFYVVSASLGVSSSTLLVAVYWLNVPAPSAVLSTLDLLTTPTREAAVSSLPLVTCTALLTLQCCARLYECWFVSIFSSTAVMNLLHYFVGFAHYVSAYSIILAHMPALVTGSSDAPFNRPGDALLCVVSALVFCAAFLMQRDTIRRLARLRTASDGSKSNKYVMPVGGAFKYLSCPHMTAEIVMYGALSMLQPRLTWAAAMVFVISNQVQVALSNHRWYRSTFKDYPPNRAAIIPHLL